MGRNVGDLNILIEWARQKGISIEISYSESSDEIGVETSSAAPAECYAQKRIVDISHFMMAWEDNLTRKVK